MTGKLKYDATNTTAPSTGKTTLANAFCMGRDSRIAGISTNPFISGSQCYTAWQSGYDTITPEGLVDGCANCIPITVPNLVGMTLSQVQAQLVTSNLMQGKTTIGTGNFGVVKSQNPAFGSAKLQKNYPIDTIIDVTVPNIVGMTSTNANAALIAANLIVGTVTGSTGTVSVQSPAAATNVLSGSSVAYTLA